MSAQLAPAILTFVRPAVALLGAWAAATVEPIGGVCVDSPDETAGARIKRAFDNVGVEMPFLQRNVVLPESQLNALARP